MVPDDRSFNSVSYCKWLKLIKDPFKKRIKTDNLVGLPNKHYLNVEVFGSLPFGQVHTIYYLAFVWLFKIRKMLERRCPSISFIVNKISL